MSPAKCDDESAKMFRLKISTRRKSNKLVKSIRAFWFENSRIINSKKSSWKWTLVMACPVFLFWVLCSRSSTSTHLRGGHTLWQKLLNFVQNILLTNLNFRYQRVYKATFLVLTFKIDTSNLWLVFWFSTRWGLKLRFVLKKFLDKNSQKLP